MSPKQSILVLSFAVANGALAQLFPFPAESGMVLCDGAIRPNWTQCMELMPQVSGSVVGPRINEGSVFSASDCRLHTLRCAGPEDNTFDLPSASGMFQIVQNECGARNPPAGGVYRSGDACAVVDHPTNPFVSKRSIEAAFNMTSIPVPAKEKQRQNKAARRNLVAEALQERQCEVPPGACHTYKQQQFETNIRGPAVRVCDDILPQGGTCIRSKTTTTEQTFTVEASLQTGIEGIVQVTGGFSSATSNSVATTLTTNIAINCPSGQGYVVWYPLFEVSSGECTEGPHSCNGEGCGVSEITTQCEMRRPINAAEGVLSGEYDVQCI